MDLIWVLTAALLIQISANGLEKHNIFVSLHLREKAWWSSGLQALGVALIWGINQQMKSPCFPPFLPSTPLSLSLCLYLPNKYKQVLKLREYCVKSTHIYFFPNRFPYSFWKLSFHIPLITFFLSFVNYLLLAFFLTS